MKLNDYFKKSDAFDDKQLLYINYGYSVIKNELSKFILLLIFYILIGHQLEYLFYLLILTPVRIFSGGLHLKSNFLCFIASFIFSFVNIYLLPLIILPDPVYWVMMISSIIISIVIAPVKNPNRPIKTRVRYINLKKKVAIFMILGSILLLILSINGSQIFYVIGVWALFMNSLQILFIQISDSRKGGENVESTIY